MCHTVDVASGSAHRYALAGYEATLTYCISYRVIRVHAVNLQTLAGAVPLLPESFGRSDGGFDF